MTDYNSLLDDLNSYLDTKRSPASVTMQPQSQPQAQPDDSSSYDLSSSGLSSDPSASYNKALMRIAQKSPPVDQPVTARELMGRFDTEQSKVDSQPKGLDTATQLIYALGPAVLGAATGGYAGADAAAATQKFSQDKQKELLDRDQKERQFEESAADKRLSSIAGIGEKEMGNQTTLDRAQIMADAAQNRLQQTGGFREEAINQREYGRFAKDPQVVAAQKSINSMDKASGFLDAAISSGKGLPLQVLKDASSDIANGMSLGRGTSDHDRQMQEYTNLNTMIGGIENKVSTNGVVEINDPTLFRQMSESLSYLKGAFGRNINEQLQRNVRPSALDSVNSTQQQAIKNLGYTPPAPAAGSASSGLTRDQKLQRLKELEGK